MKRISINNLFPLAFKILVTFTFAFATLANAWAGELFVTIDDIVLTPVTGCAEDKNGSIEVIATGPAGIEYCIGNQKWQSSNTFSGLGIGQYTVKARNMLDTTDIYTRKVRLTGPEKFSATSIGIDDYGSTGSGKVKIFNFGGTPPYSSDVSTSLPLTNFTPNMEYTALSPGTYFIETRDANGCMVEDTVKINGVNKLDGSVEVLGSADCHPTNEGGKLALTRYGLNDDTGVIFPVSYIFQGLKNNTSATFIENDGLAKFTNLPRDSFLLKIYDSSNPAKSFDTVITVSGPDPIVVADTGIVPANCKQVLDDETDVGEIHLASVTGGTAPYKYKWSHDFFATSADLTGLTGGYYTVEITDDNDCSTSETFYLPNDHSKEVFAKVLNTLDTFCYNMLDTLEAVYENETNVQWQYLNTSTFQFEDISKTIKPLDSRRYRILAWNDDNCFAGDTIFSAIYPRVIIDTVHDRTVFTDDGSFTVEVELINNNDLEYSPAWEPATQYLAENIQDYDVLMPEFMIPDTQSFFFYYLTVTSELGCKEKDTLIVKVIKDIKVYTAFSPNGDGINDTWLNDVIEGVKIDVTVFNRWGKVVFTKSGQEIKWDGTQNGVNVPIGTYYYSIRVTRDGGEYEEAGPVTIVR